GDCHRRTYGAGDVAVAAAGAVPGARGPAAAAPLPAAALRRRRRRRRKLVAGRSGGGCRGARGGAGRPAATEHGESHRAELLRKYLQDQMELVGAGEGDGGV
ncbi:unnamed protein product, partial [Urochloa humidicola]